MGELFDEFAKALAKGTSRRDALRTLAVGAIGGVMASRLGLPDEAQARRGGKKRVCRTWCREHFQGNEGRIRGCRRSDPSRGPLGECYVCGPGQPKGSNRVLCPKNPSGVCCDANDCISTNGGAKVCITASNGV